jgi:(E)-4-hydroxy-3-methylbut-2-enyl-diphosphate synthase
MEYRRRRTRQIKVADIRIGADAPIAIQSMTRTATKDVLKTVKQIERLKILGADIVRVAVKDIDDARAIKAIKERTDTPLVADIHFNYQFALEALRNGIDKIRLNPGNIYNTTHIKQIINLAKRKKIPIRIGVNSGSLRLYRGSVVDSMVKSVLEYLRILEKLDFYDIVISVKASDVEDTIQAYKKIANLCDYPFHLGVTATGALIPGTIKSTLAIGVLLREGIGDTIRVSLTSNPEDELIVAKEILQSLGIRRFSPQVISCPTCGRCEVNLIKIVNRIKKDLNGIYLKKNRLPIKKIAIMGCVVNGPGEARDADLGIAFMKDSGFVFKNGKIFRKIAGKDALSFLIKEIEKMS